MLLSNTAVLLAIVPFCIASTCNQSNALPYLPSSTSTTESSSAPTSTASSTPSGSDEGANLESCYANCGVDGTCIVNCLYDACNSHCGSSSSECYYSCLSEPCVAFFGSGSSAPDLDKLKTCQSLEAQGQCNSVGCRKMLKERDTFTCSSSETCYVDSEGSGTLFCLDTVTGTYISTVLFYLPVI
jgi:hypothetical protein